MNVRFCFSAEQLKNIALVSMVIDHAAVGLIEQSELASGVAWSLCALKQVREELFRPGIRKAGLFDLLHSGNIIHSHRAKHSSCLFRGFFTAVFVIYVFIVIVGIFMNNVFFHYILLFNRIPQAFTPCTTDLPDFCRNFRSCEQTAGK